MSAGSGLSLSGEPNVVDLGPRALLLPEREWHQFLVISNHSQNPPAVLRPGLKAEDTVVVKTDKRGPALPQFECMLFPIGEHV